MTTEHKPTSVPPCDSECGEGIREFLREHGLDGHVTHIPPLVDSGYYDLNMTCPHGVTWHTEPTSEQIAEFVGRGDL